MDIETVPQNIYLSIAPSNIFVCGQYLLGRDVNSHGNPWVSRIFSIWKNITRNVPNKRICYILSLEYITKYISASSNCLVDHSQSRTILVPWIISIMKKCSKSTLKNAIFGDKLIFNSKTTCANPGTFTKWLTSYNLNSQLLLEENDSYFPFYLTWSSGNALILIIFSPVLVIPWYFLFYLAQQPKSSCIDLTHLFQLWVQILASN